MNTEEELLEQIDISSIIVSDKYPIVVGVLPDTKDYYLFEKDMYPLSPSSIGFTDMKDAMEYISILKKLGYKERLYYF